MRCHSQAMTIKLKRDLPLAEIEQLIAGGNEWVRLVPNTREDSIRELSPARVSGTLQVPIGRLRKLRDGRRVPLGLHRRRPAAVGRRGAAAAHAADPAARAESPDDRGPPVARCHARWWCSDSSSLLNDAASEMITPLLPIFLTATLGAGPAIVGFIEGLAEATASILKLVSGRLADRGVSAKGLVVGGYGLSNAVPAADRARHRLVGGAGCCASSIASARACAPRHATPSLRPRRAPTSAAAPSASTARWTMRAP